jgi:hypothetical protein
MAYKDPKTTHKIRERISKWDKYWRINRQQYYMWIGFVMGDQWREDESRLFERYNKIPLTFNKLGVLMNHLLGDQRQNTPQLQIIPDESVPEQTAEVRAALIKNIALDSNSKMVYQNAFMQAIVGGFGAYRVGTDYVSDYTFDQDIKLYKIDDPCRCYWDMSAQTESKTDGMACGTRTRMSRKKFAAMYGKKLERSIGPSHGTDDPMGEDSTSITFADDDSITIINDYEREYDTIKIYKLSNNKIVDSKEFNKLERRKIDDIELIMYGDEPVTVLDKRDTYRYTVKHREIAGDFILDETDFPSEQLPIVYVDQNSYLDKNGQQITRSFFQDVRDAQRFLNYLATQTAYLLKVSRYDQFMAPRKSVAANDTQQIWRDPSAQQGALIYDETQSGLKPEQLRPPELSASLTQQYERCLMDIQSGTGLYNTQIGEKGNEISGSAIDARTQRGSYNTFVPFDSLNRAIITGGQIINEMIPKVYDVERLMVLAMPDRQNAQITINKATDQYGLNIENDMTQGRYKIRLMPGPSYEGQKTEALESMNMILKANPQLFNVIGDLYVENLPLPNNIELRNRIRTLVPPEIIQAGKTGQPLPPKPPQPNPDQIMAQLKQQELQQKMQQIQIDAQQKEKELSLKQAELQRKALETHADMTMEWERLQSDKEAAAAKLQESLLKYQAEMQRANADMQMGHADNLVKILTHHPKENKTQGNQNVRS